MGGVSSVTVTSSGVRDIVPCSSLDAATISDTATPSDVTVLSDMTTLDATTSLDAATPSDATIPSVAVTPLDAVTSLGDTSFSGTRTTLGAMIALEFVKSTEVMTPSNAMIPGVIATSSLPLDISTSLTALLCESCDDESSGLTSLVVQLEGAGPDSLSLGMVASLSEMFFFRARITSSSDLASSFKLSIFDANDFTPAAVDFSLVICAHTHVKPVQIDECMK